jgi:hypothetical protein
MPLPIAPSIGSRLRRDTRRQSFLWPPRARGLLGPRVSPQSRPPSPPRRLQKVSPGEASPSRHRLKHRVSEQSSRTMPASSTPRHLDGPRRTAARPSWTPAHVDHRLEPSNRLVPDLSLYIRGKVGPRGGRIPIQSPDTPFDSIRLCSAQRTRQPEEGH